MPMLCQTYLLYEQTPCRYKWMISDHEDRLYAIYDLYYRLFVSSTREFMKMNLYSKQWRINIMYWRYSVLIITLIHKHEYQQPYYHITHTYTLTINVNSNSKHESRAYLTWPINSLAPVCPLKYVIGEYIGAWEKPTNHMKRESECGRSL